METLPAIAVILIITAITTLMIILGRKVEQPIIPGIATIGNLCFLIYHSIVLDNVLFSWIIFLYICVKFSYISTFS